MVSVVDVTIKIRREPTEYLILMPILAVVRTGRATTPMLRTVNMTTYTCVESFREGRVT